MAEGGGMERKNRAKSSWGREAGRSRHPPTHAVPTPTLLSLLLRWMKTNEERSSWPQGSNNSPPALSLTLQSSPIHSLYPSSLPPSQAVPFLFCLQLSTTSLPLSTFMLLIIVPISLPPSIRQSLPYWHWPSPLCLGLEGTEGEKGRCVPDGETLNSRGHRRDGSMKRERGEKKGEAQETWYEQWKRAKKIWMDHLSLPKMTDTYKHTLSRHVSIIGQIVWQRVEDTALVKHSNKETHMPTSISMFRSPPVTSYKYISKQHWF